VVALTGASLPSPGPILLLINLQTAIDHLS